MTMRRAEIQVTRRRYPCGAVAGGPSPLPYSCPKHGVDCLLARAEQVIAWLDDYIAPGDSNEFLNGLRKAQSVMRDLVLAVRRLEV